MCHAIHPRPRQEPHPPILIGGNGRQILALAACEADIVALTGVTFSQGGTGRDFSGFTAGKIKSPAGQKACEALGPEIGGG